ncbi:MAG: 8-oxo-dGTP diphosphatase [Actinomycetota bacterium]
MPFSPLVGTLVYVWDQDTDDVLLIRRNARTDDDHFGKVNGLGGKVEPDEHIVAGARRELREEASIEATDLMLRGTITFTDFGPNREEWLVFVFIATGWAGTVPATNDEGTLEWAPRGALLAACDLPGGSDDLPMWPGDRYFIPLVFDSNPRVFHGTMPYDAHRPLSWSYERL